MSMPSADIFGLVERYLLHETDLQALQEWAAAHTRWLMAAAPDSGTELAGLLELNLAELAAGHADEDEVRDDLAAFLAAHHTVCLDAGPPERITTGSASRTFSPPGQVC